MYLKRSKYYLLLLGFVFIASCNEKDLDIEVIETACKDFFIQDVQYQFDNTPSCGDEELNMSFNYDGDIECIHQVVLNPKFYDINGNELPNFDVSTITVSKENLNITNNTIALEYCLDYPSASDESDLNYIQFDINSENEQGNASNTIGMRANIPGAPVKQPNSNDFEKEFQVKSRTISLRVYDDAAQDGDIISVNVNNDWLIENKMIFNDGETISLTINQITSNFLMLYAVNEGSSSPNTLAGSIDDGVTVQDFNLNLKTGEQVYFKLTYLP